MRLTWPLWILYELFAEPIQRLRTWTVHDLRNVLFYVRRLIIHELLNIIYLT
jgi:hypothetical protein